MKKIRTFFIYFLLVTALPYSLYAEDLASISLTPENPAPKSTVSVKLVSYYFDVNTASITWKVNNSVVLSGIGEKMLTVKTGDVGEGVAVTVLAENAEGVSVQQEVTITPSSVSILYEAPKSYVPRFYQGRSLPADGALVKVTAFPQISDGGVPVSPTSFAYTWYVNDSVVESASGYGKQSANIHINYLRNKTDVKVLVRSPLGNTASKKISIIPHEPMPLLYRHDPIMGTDFTKLFQKRLETIDDITLSLEPFYLSKKEKSSETEPSYMWTLDGLPVTPLNGKILALHPKENSYGTKVLKIVLEGPNKLIQRAETSLEILFDTR